MKKPVGSLFLQEISIDDVNIRALDSFENEDIYHHVVMNVRFRGTEGTNYFYVKVATPESLLKNSQDNYLLVKNRTLVVAYFNFDLLLASIEAIISSCSMATWDESCDCLLKFFAWEYEQYRN